VQQRPEGQDDAGVSFTEEWGVLLRTAEADAKLQMLIFLLSEEGPQRDEACQSLARDVRSLADELMNCTQPRAFDILLDTLSTAPEGGEAVDAVMVVIEHTQFYISRCALTTAFQCSAREMAQVHMAPTTTGEDRQKHLVDVLAAVCRAAAEHVHYCGQRRDMLIAMHDVTHTLTAAQSQLTEAARSLLLDEAAMHLAFLGAESWNAVVFFHKLGDAETTKRWIQCTRLICPWLPPRCDLWCAIHSQLSVVESQLSEAMSPAIVASDIRSVGG